MISLFVRASLALLVFNALLTPADALRHRETNYGTYDRGYNGYNGDNGYPKTVVGTSSGPTQPPPRRGLGISAWGIVFLVVALILAGMGLYYFSICYGICSPTTKKYDKMGMPTLA